MRATKPAPVWATRRALPEAPPREAERWGIVHRPTRRWLASGPAARGRARVARLPAGKHELRFEFEPTGEPDLPHGKGAPGRLQLSVDGGLVGDAEAAVTTPFIFNPGALTCGANPGSPVTPGERRADPRLRSRTARPRGPAMSAERPQEPGSSRSRSDRKECNDQPITRDEHTIG